MCLMCLISVSSYRCKPCCTNVGALYLLLSSGALRPPTHPRAPVRQWDLDSPAASSLGQWPPCVVCASACSANSSALLCARTSSAEHSQDKKNLPPGFQLSAFSFQLFQLSFQLSAFSFQLFSFPFSFQLSVFSFFSFAFSFQLSVFSFFSFSAFRPSKISNF